jgi:hypothetical protein
MRRLTLAAALAAALLATLATAAVAKSPHAATTLAVIGDTPYGDEQVAQFPGDIAEINADRDVRRVIHLGDIKNAARAAAFGKPVLLLQGDSHTFLVDTPPGMPANLTRLVVQGSTSVPHEWLRLRLDPKAKRVFTCENVVFRSGAATPCPGPLGGDA